MKNSTNIKCFESFTVLPSNLIYDDDLLCRWQWMTRDDQGILLCSKSMLDALFWCHRGWTEEMLSAGVSGRGAGYPCYIYTCQQKPAVQPSPSSHSVQLSTGQTTDTQHAQNWIFSVSSTQPLSRWRGWGHHTYCLGVWSIYGLIIIQLGPYYMVKFMKLNYWEF